MGGESVHSLGRVGRSKLGQAWSALWDLGRSRDLGDDRARVLIDAIRNPHGARQRML